MTDDERWDFAAEGHLLTRGDGMTRSSRGERATLVISTRRAMLIGAGGLTTNVPFEATVMISIRHARMRRKLVEIVYEPHELASSVRWIPRSPYDADPAAETLAENVANRWLHLGLGRFSVSEIESLDSVASSASNRDRSVPSTWRFPDSARAIVQDAING